MHKVRAQNFANFWSPHPLPVRSVYAVALTLPCIPLYARTQYDLMFSKYNKHNIE